MNILAVFETGEFFREASLLIKVFNFIREKTLRRIFLGDLQNVLKVLPKESIVAFHTQETGN